MLRDSNHLGFLIALLLAAVYASCGPRPPAPTQPATPVATVTQSPTRTHLPIKTPPVILTPTERLPTPTRKSPNDRTWSAQSPDGHWIAEGALQEFWGEPCEVHTSLTVKRVAGSQAWEVWSDKQNCGLGGSIPIALQWSSDGQRFYFTNLVLSDGCAEFSNGSDLHQVNLNTGAVKQIAPAIGSALALSPDETQLAYMGQRGLIVRDLISGVERESALPTGAQAGRLLWSPDGSALVFTLTEQPCSGIDSIILVDVQTRQQQTLIENDKRGTENRQLARS